MVRIQEDVSATDTDDGAASLFMACSNPERVSATRRPDSSQGSDDSDQDADDGDDGSDGDNGSDARRVSSDHEGQEHVASHASGRRSPDAGGSDEGCSTDASEGSCSDASSRRSSPRGREPQVARSHTVRDCSVVEQHTPSGASDREDRPASHARRRFEEKVQQESEKHVQFADMRSGGFEEPEDVYAKQSLLRDLARLKRQPGVQLTKEWTMLDDIDDMEFELKRITLHIDESNNVDMMRNALQLAVTGVEMVSKRYNILDLDGWSSEAVRTMAKHDRSLARLYRKYWRRGFSASPESDIALSLVASMGMYHAKKKVSGHMFAQGGFPQAPRPHRPKDSKQTGSPSTTLYESSDDEQEEQPPP